MNQIRKLSTASMNTTYLPDKAIELYPASSVLLLSSDIEELHKLEQKDKCHSEDRQFFYSAILIPAKFEKISAKENLIIQYP